MYVCILQSNLIFELVCSGRCIEGLVVFFLSSGGTADNPRYVKHLARVNRNDRKAQVSYVMDDFTNTSLCGLLGRIEQFIDSSSIVNLSQLELSFRALRDIRGVPGGGYQRGDEAGVEHEKKLHTNTEPRERMLLVVYGSVA